MEHENSHETTLKHVLQINEHESFPLPRLLMQRTVHFALHSTILGTADEHVDRTSHPLPNHCDACQCYCVDVWYTCLLCPRAFDLCEDCYKKFSSTRGKLPSRKKRKFRLTMPMKVLRHRHMPEKFRKIIDDEEDGGEKMAEIVL